MIYASTLHEMVHVTFSQYLDRILPHRKVMNAIKASKYVSKESIRKAKAISDGDQYTNMELVSNGMWAEISPGLWARRIIFEDSGSSLSRRMDIIELNATDDVIEDVVHRHLVGDVRSSQVFFIDTGVMSVDLYDSYKGNLIRSYKIKRGESTHINPEQYHAVKFKKGTTGISIYMPPVS